MDKTDLDPETVIALDKVKKKQKLTKEEHKCLKDQNLVEGRYPNLFMTAPVAALAGDKSQYIRNKAFDKEYYKKLIVACLKEYPESSRKEEK